MKNDDAHWHLLVNHWPILGGMLATFVLAYGLVRRSSDVITLSYWLLLLVAISTGVSKQTGGAAKRRLAELGLLNETMLNAHREASDWATWAMYLTAVLAGLALAWSRTRQYRYWPVLVLAGAVITSGLMAYVGSLGGVIRHTEIRDPASKLPIRPAQ